MPKTKIHPHPMNNEELAAIQKELGLHDLDVAAIGAIERRSLFGWRQKGSVQNGFAIVLLRILHAHPELVPVAWKLAGLPDGRPVEKVGRPKKKSAKSERPSE